MTKNVYILFPPNMKRWEIMLKVETQLDKKGRVLIPKQFRKAAKISPFKPLILRLENSDHIILEREEHFRKHTKETDPFMHDIHNPMHIDPKKIKKIDLEKLEDEMWYP